MRICWWPRAPQGIAAVMMMPVGRMANVRTFPKHELLGAINFVIIPAPLGPLLGPTVGGLRTRWFGLRHMPDYHGYASTA